MSVNAHTLDEIIEKVKALREALQNPRSICIQDGDRSVEIHFFETSKAPANSDYEPLALSHKTDAEIEADDKKENDELDFYHES